MKLDRLEKIIAVTMEAHDRRYSGDDSLLSPMYLLFRGEEIVSVAVVEISGYSWEKDAVVGRIQELASKGGCDGYSFSSESWTLPPEAAASHRGGDLSHHPERIEVLSVEAGLSDGSHALLVSDMERSEGSVVLRRRPLLVDGRDAKCSSRFNIFNPRIPEPYGSRDGAQACPETLH